MVGVDAAAKTARQEGDGAVSLLYMRERERERERESPWRNQSSL